MVSELGIECEAAFSPGRLLSLSGGISATRHLAGGFRLKRHTQHVGAYQLVDAALKFSGGKMAVGINFAGELRA
jgi:hypothetical protein